MYAFLILTALAAPPEFNDGYAFAMKATQETDFSKMSFAELIEDAKQRAAGNDSPQSASGELERLIDSHTQPSPRAECAAADSHDYATMRSKAIRTGEPLVVLLTRDYCAPCETMKVRLDGMAIDYAIVHYGRDPATATKIGTRGLTPELVVYDHVGPARHLEGVQSVHRIREFLDGTRARAAAGEIRLPGPAHALRGTMCGSRGCQMCVGIALRNLGITPEGRSLGTWLAQYDNHFNADRTVKQSLTVASDPYGETPTETVHAMLNLADLRPGETLYDLGSGDGRIAIAAAERGARAIGYEIDADLVEEARDNAYGTQYVTFEQQDVTTASFPGADVLACYLTPQVTSRVDFDALQSGVRIVCHEFPLEGVEPKRVVAMPDGRSVYLYQTPLQRKSANRAAKSVASGCSGGSCGIGGRLFGGLFCRSCR